MRNFVPILLVATTIVFTLPLLPIEPATSVEPMQMSLPAPTAVVIFEPLESTQATTEPVSAYPLKEWERSLICRVMMSECPYEPDEGQRAVAQVILDRLLSDEYPVTVYEVLTQHNQFASPSDEDVNDSVIEAVAAVFDHGERVTEAELLYFYAPRYGVSLWHERQTYIIRIGGHKFFT